MARQTKQIEKINGIFAKINIKIKGCKMAPVKTSRLKDVNKQKPSEIQGQLNRFLELEYQAKKIKQEQEDLKAILLKHCNDLGIKELSSEYGKIKKDIANTYSLATDLIPQLKSALGGQYKFLVTEKINYTPTASLRKMATDPNTENVDLLRNAIIINTRESIKAEPNPNKFLN